MSSLAEVNGHRRLGGKNDEDDESDQDGAPLKEVSHLKVDLP